MQIFRPLGFRFLLLLPLALACARSKSPIPEPPSAAPKKISYLHDVHPILARSCAQCHTRGKHEGGLSIESREALLKGGETGPGAIPGSGAESLFIKIVSGTAEDGRVMPMKGPRLKPEEIEILKKWIDEGLAWEASDPSKLTPLAPLAPRKPELPVASNSIANPIDQILAPYFKQHSIRPGKPVDDAFFARRAFFDVTGLPPSPEKLEAFMKDRRRDKREALVESLLADPRPYAEHWMSFWNDMLRNDFTGTGYIDGGRRQITDWLYKSLASNKPYDQFVRELIAPDQASVGFINGIVWRGVTNASQTPPMQAAQNISQVFMGTNLKCASCHDSFINQWKLKDSYGLASIFAEGPLELVRCDAPQGEMAQMHFIFPELGQIDASLSRPKRLEQLAATMTQKQNGRLTRTVVNRFWGRLFGRAIVEPVDDMDQKPWSADLLDYLAWDLAEHGYDLKRTLKLIMTSNAYQLPAVSIGERAGSDYVFRGPAVRRLSGEQYLDAISSVTGVWRNAQGATIDFSTGYSTPTELEADLKASTAPAQWIWTSPGAAEKASKGTVYFRRTVDLGSAAPTLSEADFMIEADNKFVLYVNGKKVSNGSLGGAVGREDLRPHLAPGKNTLAVEVENTEEGPAGLLAVARFRRGGEKFDFVSDAAWISSNVRTDGWEKPEFAAEGWTPAVALGPASLAPWNLDKKLYEAARLAIASRDDTPRAWLGRYNPFYAALGRPNREQVVTTRNSVATTLEALELTNGPTLSAILKESAGKLVAEKPKDSKQLTREVYLRALARRPSWRESRLTRRVLGAKPEPSGVEDFLWAIFNSPDFQLIY